MATLPGLQTIKVEIMMDGLVLKEYDNPGTSTEPPNTITKYVQSRSGSEYSIQHSWSKDFPKDQPVSIQVMVDGNIVSRQVDSVEKINRGGSSTLRGAKSLLNGEWIRQSFRFSELEIGEADGLPANLELERSLESTGEISVAFYFIKSYRRVIGRDRHRKLEVVGGLKEQHLKAKTLSHQTSLGLPKRIPPLQSYRTERASKEPFAKYIFKYRSLEALKADGIIPRTPSPVPLERRGIENLSLEERGQLLERLLAEPSVKRERSDDDVDVHMKSVKTEYAEDENGVVILD